MTDGARGVPSVVCGGAEPESGPARDSGGRLQSRNVPFATSGVSREEDMYGKTETLYCISDRTFY